ncbi:pentatricopeptide repeat-containing protein [Prunus yedoensis var. nudiflora]|uniref:Pentatricopeptide repeat-containing protein n=1 Tax=Prunus yedoensis var. nudiflora TaxID=2094558 RepID=A0A314ZUQ3_PRUYE|nr:pentatricopeptide repeat-containing protein [Prunus yedoensis var. nudiflora]
MLASTKNSLLFFLHRSKPQTHCVLIRHLATVNAAPQNGVVPNKDDYFSAIQHITNIVRRDHFMERTLNKLRITVDSELVYRVLRACSAAGTESLRFFNWARTHHPPITPQH